MNDFASYRIPTSKETILGKNQRFFAVGLLKTDLEYVDAWNMQVFI